jgi:murein DD-endopeptidase MepM/ murein hydrolase activator NlpD
MEKTFLNFRKIFGFARSRSLIGKHAQQKLNHHRARRVISVLIIALATSTYLIHNLANIGGPVVLNLGSSSIPNTVIDARTNSSAQLPIEFTYESRGFSWLHAGADLVAPTGASVKPIMKGVVQATQSDPFGYGSHVIVDHGGNLKSIYGHLSKIEVQVGQEVTLNTEIGKSGSTGFSTGPHLHLEIQENSTPINPAEIVPGIN